MTEREKISKELSRREFLKDAGLLVGGTAIGSTVLLAACGDAEIVTETTTKTVTETGGLTTVTTTGPGSTETTTFTQEISSFVCPYCGSEFDTLSELKDHVETEHAGEPVKYAPAKFILQHDNAKCSMCQICASICSMVHFDGMANPQLGGIRLTKADYVNRVLEVTTCRQCEAPSCIQACMFGAISIDETTGARVIDLDKCTGCRQCEQACPFGAIVFNEDINKCFKCDQCGGEPACAKYCPTGALSLVSLTEGGA